MAAQKSLNDQLQSQLDALSKKYAELELTSQAQAEQLSNQSAMKVEEITAAKAESDAQVMSLQQTVDALNAKLAQQDGQLAQL